MVHLPVIHSFRRRCHRFPFAWRPLNWAGGDVDRSRLCSCLLGVYPVVLSNERTDANDDRWRGIPRFRRLRLLPYHTNNDKRALSYSDKFDRAWCHARIPLDNRAFPRLPLDDILISVLSPIEGGEICHSFVLCTALPYRSGSECQNAPRSRAEVLDLQVGLLVSPTLICYVWHLSTREIHKWRYRLSRP